MGLATLLVVSALAIPELPAEEPLITARPGQQDIELESADSLGVLYDQTDFPSLSELPIQDFPETFYDPQDSEAADDFVVSGSGGWSIHELRVLVRDTGGPTGLVSVGFYEDDQGFPAATPISGCDYTGMLTYAATPVDGDLEWLSITLTLGGTPVPCALPQGTYWVAVEVRKAKLGGGTIFWRQRDVQSNQGAVWRNPPDGWETGCTEWGRAGTDCGFDAPDLIFQVRGTALPSYVDDTDDLDALLGPDPFPVEGSIDITEAEARMDVCDFACSGGPETCCGTAAAAGGEPSLVFSMNLVGEGSEPQLAGAEYVVYIDFGEEGLGDVTEEPGVLFRHPANGTADVKLSLDLKRNKRARGHGERGRSLFRGLDGVEILSHVDQETGTIRFVVPVASLASRATGDQAVSSGFDQYHRKSASFLLWFQANTRWSDEGPGAARELTDRAPNTNDNRPPTIAEEALQVTVPFECAHALCETGVALESTCHSCVKEICDRDPYCCEVEWDMNCAADVPHVCALDCP